jgi:hypothetical protein
MRMSSAAARPGERQRTAISGTRQPAVRPRRRIRRVSPFTSIRLGRPAREQQKRSVRERCSQPVDATRWVRRLNACSTPKRVRSAPLRNCQCQSKSGNDDTGPAGSFQGRREGARAPMTAAESARRRGECHPVQTNCNVARARANTADVPTARHKCRGHVTDTRQLVCR